MMANSARQYGGDYAKALAAYNAGSGVVNHAVNACGSAWMNCLPAETRHYIYMIMGI
jgi:soluble lytic murein transglycosylase-like protein